MYSQVYLLSYMHTSTPLQHVLISWLLKLACACLSFDFIGTTTDESADDLATVQIPTSWRPTFLDCTTLQLFFNLFHSLTASLAAMVSCSSLPPPSLLSLSLSPSLLLSLSLPPSLSSLSFSLSPSV